jgi:hypothetical protein
LRLTRSSGHEPAILGITVSTSAGGLRPLLRWQLAAASLGAAAIHFAVIVPHFNEYTAFGVFFLVVAWFQAAWACWSRRPTTAGCSSSVSSPTPSLSSFGSGLERPVFRLGQIPGSLRKLGRRMASRRRWKL